MSIGTWWQKLFRAGGNGVGGGRATARRRTQDRRRSAPAELLEERVYLSASSIGEIGGVSNNLNADHLEEDDAATDLSAHNSSDHAAADHDAEDGLDALWYLPPDYSGPLPGEEHGGDESNHFAASGFKWSQPGGPGTTLTVTYSYSNLLNGGLGGSLTTSQLRAAVEEALGLWAKVVPISFVEVADSGPTVSDASYASANYPQIRIGHEFIDGPSGPNILAHAWYPMGTGIGGDLHLDNSNVWTLGHNGGIDILEVLTHELGHTLGLAHESMPSDGGQNAVMNPFYAKRFATGLGSGFLLQDDIDGARALYGRGIGAVIPLSNPGDGGVVVDDHGNSVAESTILNLGASKIGTIETGGDQDWFQFQATAGVTYIFQTTLGTLPDSTLRLFGQNGSTVLGFNDNGNSLGAASRIEWRALTSGTYFLAVQAPQTTQLGSYALTASVKNIPPVLAAISDRTASHNQDVITVPLSAVDGNGDPLSFSASVLTGSNPQASAVALRMNGSVLTIDPPENFVGRFRVEVAVTDTVFSDSETFWVTITNSAVALAPIADLTMSHAADQLEVPLAVTDADNDDLTFDVTVRGRDLAYQLDQTYGFYATPDFLENNYYFNKRNAGEKYLRGADGAWYLLFADGTLLRWKKSVSKSTHIATLDPKYYNDPSLLCDVPLAVFHQMSGTVSGDSLLIDCPVGSLDTFEVQVDVSDGLSATSRTFTVQVTNSAPVLQPIGNQTLSSSADDLQIPLLATDADGDTIAYSVNLETGNPAAQLDQTYGMFVTPDFLANDYYLNTRHRREKYVMGENGEWFFIRPGGKVYKWGTKIKNSKLIATLGDEYYRDPSLLCNAAIAIASITGGTLTINPVAGFTGSFQVTVAASDGTSSDSETFLVNVTSNIEIGGPSSLTSFDNTLYLNFDGADLSREELVAWAGEDWRDILDSQFDPEGDGLSVEAFLFDWPERDAFIDQVISLTQQQLADFGVTVVRQTGDAVAGIGATTVFVGVPEIAGSYERWVGLASDVDVGNDNATDIAFALPFFATDSFDDNARALANLILHEAGHTWGLHHVESGETPDLMGLSHEEDGIAALARPDAGFLNQSFPGHEDDGGGLGAQNSYATLAALFARPSPALSAEQSTRRAAVGELVATDTGTKLKTLA